MYRFEQIKARNDCATKTINRRKPKVTFEEVCECESKGVESLCGKFAKGCRLTTKPQKRFPFPVAPITTYEELTQAAESATSDFVREMKTKVVSLLLEMPKDIHVKQLLGQLNKSNKSQGNQCTFKVRKTRPTRILTNREITNKIWRRKLLRERRCGEKLGPYQQVDPATLTSDLFMYCKNDRFKSCMQKKKQIEEETAQRKEFEELAVQTDESYIEQMKASMVTKEALDGEEMNRLREERTKMDEKRRLKKLKRDASVTLLDWNVKPNPCKTLLNSDGTCQEKDVNDSDVDSEDDKIECTCHNAFKYCLAMDFLRRKDYQHNWMPSQKCAEASAAKATDDD